jgi:membrane fusion protein (multidrug efflux system)
MRWKSKVAWIVLRVLAVVLGLAVVVILIAWVAGAFVFKIPPGQTEIAARKLGDQPTAIVTIKTKPHIEEALGTFRAKDRNLISSKILATIEDIGPQPGDKVSAGDVLVTFSSNELVARLKQAERAVEAGEARRKAAEAAFRRAERLRVETPGALSSGDYDEIVARLQIAQAEERKLLQVLREAEVMQGYTEIKATKPARVVKRYLEPGDTARPGEPIIELYDERTLRLEAPVVEKLALSLRRQDESRPLTVRIDALDRQVETTIDEIVPQADAASRSFLIRAQVPITGDLYEGMFGRLLIPTAPREHLCVPEQAIRRTGQLEFVDVVQADETLRRRMVRTGRRGGGDRVDVISGLSAGERVVVFASDEEEGGSR